MKQDLSDDTLYTIPMVYDSLCPFPVVSDTIDPVCGLIVEVEDRLQHPELYRLKVFPNPATQQVTVVPPGLLEKHSGPDGFRATTVYYQWGGATLDVHDLNGKKREEYQLLQAGNGLNINVSDWPPGLYLFRLIYRGECVANATVMVGK